MSDNDIMVIGSVEAKFSDCADLITLTAPIAYVIPEIDREVTVKAGFQTDGASIPKFFWRLVGHPFMHSFLPAAILHDALYLAELLSRRVADWIFLLLLLQLAFLEFWRERKQRRRWTRLNLLRRVLRAYAMWLAVRLFGGFVWRRHTAQDVAEARHLVTLT